MYCQPTSSARAHGVVDEEGWGLNVGQLGEAGRVPRTVVVEREAGRQCLVDRPWSGLGGS